MLSPSLSVGYVEADLRASTACVVKHYLASAGLYGLLLAVLALNPWFRRLLSIDFNGVTALRVYGWLYLLYLGLALPVYLAARPASLVDSKNLLIFDSFRRAIHTALGRIRRAPTPALALSDKEKHAVAFLLIKLFYGPLMLNSAFSELRACQGLNHALHSTEFLGSLDWAYIMLVHVVFLVDSCLFFVGYHTEAGFLRNKIRYVETNGWRILVCIVCYPPFNQVTMSVFGNSLEDPYILVAGNFRSVWTWGLRGVAVLFLLLLISSSGSLFTRASNLTNRGIVSWGPYRYVRHPGYLAKNLFWLTTLLPGLVPNTRSVFFSWKTYWLYCICLICGFIAWGTIYFLRAVTEEQFLSRDPEYVAYCQKVKWRFIPGVY
jgi:protein-S-isoprenylcysteine O-methyltransferase Ste14